MFLAGGGGGESRISPRSFAICWRSKFLQCLNKGFEIEFLSPSIRRWNGMRSFFAVIHLVKFQVGKRDREHQDNGDTFQAVSADSAALKELAIRGKIHISALHHCSLDCHWWPLESPGNCRGNPRGHSLHQHNSCRNISFKIPIKEGKFPNAKSNSFYRLWLSNAETPCVRYLDHVQPEFNK